MIKLMKFPELRQTYNYDCGANAMQCVLAYYGFDIREEEIIKTAKTNKEEGTDISGLKKVAKKFGLRFKAEQMTIDFLKQCIDKNIPVIIPIQAWSDRKIKQWDKTWKSGHYIIPIGYDKKRMYFQDPAAIVRTFLPFQELEERWHDIDEKKKIINFGIMFYGKKPDYDPNEAIYMDDKSYDKEDNANRIVQKKCRKLK